MKPTYCTQPAITCESCSLTNYRRDCANNPLQRDIGVYTVGGDAGDLEGWTPERLADALTEPLAARLIRVECTPRQSGTGLELWDLSSAEEDRVREEVKQIIDQVIEDGHAG